MSTTSRMWIHEYRMRDRYGYWMPWCQYGNAHATKQGAMASAAISAGELPANEQRVVEVKTTHKVVRHIGAAKVK